MYVNELNFCKIEHETMVVKREKKMNASNWPTIMIDSHVAFTCFLSVYCLISIVYQWGKGKHLTLNLDVINIDIVPNTMHCWNYYKTHVRYYMNSKSNMRIHI
jgi:hypothetical protein